jgi:hypothetical protein
MFEVRDRYTRESCVADIFAMMIHPIWVYLSRTGAAASALDLHSLRMLTHDYVESQLV